MREEETEEYLEEINRATDQQLAKHDQDVMNGNGYYTKDGNYIKYENVD